MSNNIDYKIKAILYFFDNKYDEDISDKILSIIDDNNIDYTSNNNGFFINLNTLDNDILDIIYDIVISSSGVINMNDGLDNDNLLSNNIINISNVTDIIDSLDKHDDNINYSNIDSYLLELSTYTLTI
tara:strand:+ start:167 stop:550 length:384 start_codon:yes stop_codon:yes gene_type:complete